MKSKTSFRAVQAGVITAIMVALLVLSSSRLGRAQAGAGQLNIPFGSAGKVTTDFFGSADEAHGLVVQSDGKIVTAGSAFNPSTGFLRDFALARFNGDGSLDASFGLGGKVVTDFGQDDRISAIALQPDGKIIAAGYAFKEPSDPDFALASYDPGVNGAEPAFDVCLQDDSNGDTLKLNSTTGDYQFTKCDSFVLTGTGMVSGRGGSFSLQHFTDDRRVIAKFDTTVSKGTASVSLFSHGTFTITDRDLKANTCICPERPITTSVMLRDAVRVKQ